MNRSLIGRRYGRLVVVEDTGKVVGRNHVYQCHCDCGNVIEASSSNLSRGRKLSCGCLYAETRPKDNSIMQEGRERKKVDGVEIGKFIGRNNSNNTSGYKRVSRHGHGWRAKITIRGKTYRTPVFDTLEEAHKARLRLEDELLPNN